MQMSNPECTKCKYLPPDLLAAVLELAQLREDRYRGTIEFHLDGSGHIKSRKMTNFKEIYLTSSRK